MQLHYGKEKIASSADIKTAIAILEKSISRLVLMLSQSNTQYADNDDEVNNLPSYWIGYPSRWKIGRTVKAYQLYKEINPLLFLQ